MKKMKTKVAVALLALTCASACVGAGVVLNKSIPANGVTASAETTTRTITKAGQANGSNASVLYLYALEGDGCPEGVGNWSDEYTLVEGSGNGIKFNGEDFAYVMKQPGDIFLELGEKTATAGDEVTIDGTFYSANADSNIVFKNCGLRYNGETWETFTPEVPATVFNVTELAPAGGCTASVIYAYPTKDAKPTVNNWSDAFTFVEGTGTGICLNGEALTAYDLKQPGDFYIDLKTTAAEGDIFTLDGEFYNATLNVKIVFTNCALRYNGETWETYASEPETPPETEYTTYNIGKVNVSSGDANHVYIAGAEGVDFGGGDWTNKIVFREGTGAGMMRGDFPLTDIKAPEGKLYVGSIGAEEGSVLTIGGTFYNDVLKVEYVITECSFTFNGTAWVNNDQPVVEYTDYELGVLAINTPSNNGDASTRSDHLYLKRADGEELPYPDSTWSTTFTLESGDGLKVNGETRAIAEIKSTNAGFWMAFSGVSEGDIVTLSGVFVCPEKGARYIIEESTFVWTGRIWEDYKEVIYDTYDVEGLKVGAPSKDGRAKNSELYIAYEEEMPYGTWDDAFSPRADATITINGVPSETQLLKSPGKSEGENWLYIGFDAVPVGAELVIKGTFYNQALELEYVLEETKFIWNGAAWENYVEYTVYEVGALTTAYDSREGNPSTTQLYLALASGEALPFTDADWAYVFKTSVDGFLKINGESAFKEMKVPNNFFFAFEEVKTHDEVTVGGTFYNEEIAVKYVLPEQTFIWNGTTWEDKVEYTNYEVGELNVTTGENASETFVYFARVDGGEFVVNSWDYTFPFRQDSGVGITLNGVALTTREIKSPGNKLFINLGDVTVNEGDVLVIGGTFYNVKTGTAYIVTESTFLFKDGAWISPLDLAKQEAKAELDAHQATYDANNYYETEWTSLLQIVSEAKASVDAATAQAEIAALIEEAKAAMAEVPTKEEADALLTDEAKTQCKAELATYKTEADYRAAEWTAIQEIIAGANAKIDEATTATEVVNAFNEAKTAMDALKTKAQWEADEAAVAAAKAEVAAYVSEADYKATQWAEVQAIVAEAQTAIEAALGNQGAIDGIVAEAKATIDEVYTAAEMDEAITAAKAEISTYKTEADYRAEEWAQIQNLVLEATAELDGALTVEQINGIVEEAKADLDEVKTDAQYKAEEIYDDAKAAVANYKVEADYRAEEWAQIQTIIAEANTSIESAKSIEELNTIVANAQAAMDALKTKAQYETEEAAIAEAKAEIANYKAEADYRAEEWAQIQAILSAANGAIDMTMGNQEAIDAIVTEAKSAMDALKTAVQWQADEAAVATAKASLASYKSEADYRAEEWTAIQAILTEANTKIDEAMGNQQAINVIVSEAKAAMDAVKTAAQLTQEALAQVKTAAKNEVRAYASAIDYNLYSEDAAATINGYIAAANKAIDEATSEDAINAAVAQLKANVESVEKLGADDGESSGCGSFISGGLAASMALTAAVGAVVLRKKKED